MESSAAESSGSSLPLAPPTNTLASDSSAADSAAGITSPALPPGDDSDRDCPDLTTDSEDDELKPSPYPKRRAIRSEYDDLIQRQDKLDRVMGFNDRYRNKIREVGEKEVLEENLNTGVLQYGTVVTESFAGLGTGSAAGCFSFAASLAHLT